MDIPRPPKNKKKKAIGYAAGIVLAVVLVTVAISGLDPAAPSVERAAIFTGDVVRGTMLIQVRAPGTLVPEQIRFVSALTAGRIERKRIMPGTEVDSGTVLLEMSNPDVQLEALEAERQLTQALSERVNLRASLETNRLNQEGVVATIRTQFAEARRTAMAAESLAQNNLMSDFEVQGARERALELETRVRIEESRLRVMTESMGAQLETQESQVERMRAIVSFQRTRLASMVVKAGTRGVLQDMPLEEGQWVTPGTTLARVVQPERLKAVLRVPEVQARDVVLGLSVMVDTRADTIPGRVVRIDPSVQNGTVSIDVALLVDSLPRGARPDLSVDGIIEIARLEDALYTGRPTFGQANSTVGLFTFVDDGAFAERVQVRLGRTSVNAVQILGGLDLGDVVILSDMSQYDNTDRVRIR
ncbi:MAG TPA: HlyD family efflux transporter periplasmic adaptor subunit [Gemmatimonadales bacterium]